MTRYLLEKETDGAWALVPGIETADRAEALRMGVWLFGTPGRYGPACFKGWRVVPVHV